MRTANQLKAHNREYFNLNPIAQQLSSVGFKPTTTVKPTIEALVDGLLAPTIRIRKIIITKAGEFVRARYEGRKTFVFGFDVKTAVSRLKTWDGEAA
jgi:hypothetical protein